MQGKMTVIQHLLRCLEKCYHLDDFASTVLTPLSVNCNNSCVISEKLLSHKSYHDNF